MAISQSLQSMADGSLGIAINVPFIVSPLPTPGGLSGAPNLLGLSTAQLATGGTLAGGHSYYYYLTAVDSFGDESGASIPPIEVIVPAGTNTNQVELLGNNFVFDKNAVTFNVYRSIDSPVLPLLISSGNTVPTGAAFSFTDTGFSTSNLIAPNGALSSVRVYWRVKGTQAWKLGDESENAFQVLDVFPGSGLTFNWAAVQGTFAVSGGNVSVATTGTASRACAAWASGVRFGNDQWAQAVIKSAQASGKGMGIAVRMATSGEMFYAFYCDNTTAYLFKVVAGTTTVLSSTAHTSTVGDVMYLSVLGTALQASINGTSILTATDSAISTGVPGIQGLNTSGPSIGLFQAGNLLSSLNFFVPLTFGGNQLDIQLRCVDGQGNETSQQYAPLTNYAVTAPPPTIQLPAHLSYVPESNPLTGHDAGSNATINIASFTMLVAGIPISVSGGSLTGLAYNTLYFIYYSDPFLAGGAVTYVESTTKSDALNSPNNFFVGSITTPRAGAPDTVGNNDGGSGAQNGSLNTYYFGNSTQPLPTGSVSGVGAGVTGMTLTGLLSANDGDPTTAATISATSSSVGGTLVAVSNPAALTVTRATNATLFVAFSVPVADAGNGAAVTITWGYGLSGGGTLYSAAPAVVAAFNVLSVSIPNGVNLGSVWVIVELSGATGSGKTVTVKAFEAWIQQQN